MGQFEQDILTETVGKSILLELRKIRDMVPADFPFDVKKGSFLLQVESYLFSRIGEDSAGQMHTGRSRIDQGATVRRLYDRKRILGVLDRLNEFQGALIQKAAQHSTTILPGAVATELPSGSSHAESAARPPRSRTARP